MKFSRMNIYHLKRHPAKMLLSAFFITILLQMSVVKCYDLNSFLGRLICFDNTREKCGKDFVHTYPHLSMSVTNVTVADTFMLLYTRRSPEPEKLHQCAGKLPPNSNFDPENDVIVITMPLFASFCNIAVFREWVVQLLEKGDYNIIVIDHSWGNQIDYETVILNMKIVVRYQAVILLRNIQNQIGVPFVRLTIIGLSLGAQLAGMIGALFPVDRIIGLDPARPGFEKDKTALEDRLDPSDAQIVEVWHCNAGDCLPHLAVSYEAGHVNFFMNGGTRQPSCHPYAFDSILKGDIIYGFGTLVLQNFCPHAQCLQYFKVSINPGNCQFVGVRCNSKKDFQAGKCRSCGRKGDNCLIVGFDTYKYIKEIPTEPQNYFVKTSLKCPYCDDKYVKLGGYKDTYLSSLESGQKEKGNRGISHRNKHKL